MKAASPYLTTEEAAIYLRKQHADGSANLRAFSDLRRHLKDKGRPLRVYRLGRKSLFFKQADLDALFEEEAPPRAVAGVLRGVRVAR